MTNIYLFLHNNSDCKTILFYIKLALNLFKF